MSMTSDPMPVAHGGGPHPDLVDKLQPYGQLVGIWDVDNRYLDPTDGQCRRGTVEWTFGWILDGRAVQDVMRFRFEYGSAPIGTTMRLLNPSTNTWRVIWSPSRQGVHAKTHTVASCSRRRLSSTSSRGTSSARA